MKCSFPEHREGLTEWKGEIGDGVQDFLGKLFARNGAFRGMEGNVLNNMCVIIKKMYIFVHELIMFTNTEQIKIMNKIFL